MNNENKKKPNPLQAYSLAGMGNALAENAEAAEPLLGTLCLRGEVSVWYAPPNTGKTLIILALVIDAVTAGLMEGEDVFYVNADDSAQGLAAKVQVADDFGINCLAPGQQGFELNRLVPAMQQMARDGTAKGKLVVVDTLKKVADLMSKSECREFGKAARAFSLAGGTFIGLAHTNKARSSSQKLIYAGTTDVLEDFDSAYLIDPEGTDSAKLQKVVRFECIKSRGPNTQEAYYRYSTVKDLAYHQRLSTVEETEPVYGMNEPSDDGPDPLISAAVEQAIREGVTTKMRIAAEVQRRTNISRGKVLAFIEAHTGPDPAVHRWHFRRVDRGAHQYELHRPSAANDKAGTE
ncbi:AAA family ATPase [Croceicoccus sediminis]|uniref:AAA family ATPase n=1 Tax=Croceicoccus sediminis TaxID=2571150 RepID=UPI001184334F|nr:AAA family ATPase [Croceicoccus sediminis]